MRKRLYALYREGNQLVITSSTYSLNLDKVEMLYYSPNKEFLVNIGTKVAKTMMYSDIEDLRLEVRRLASLG